MARGAFDMQAIYRAAVFDEARSEGTRLVDVDGNVFIDLFSSFALGALGYNHPDLLAVARSEAFARAAVNPTSTPFVTSTSWFDFIEQIERHYAPAGMASIFCVDGGGEGTEAAMKAAFVVHGERRRAAAGGPADPLQLPADALAAAKPAQPKAATVAKVEPARRKRQFPYRKVEDIEQDIADTEEEKEELARLLEEPETYRDGRRAKEVQENLEAVQATLDRLYRHWEEASELNG
jgi:4-aminobutyrate aminotransferase-like enzyme